MWSEHVIITWRSNTQYLCNPLHKTSPYGHIYSSQMIRRMCSRNFFVGGVTLYLCEFKIMNADENNLWMSQERMTWFEDTVCATHTWQCSLQHKTNRRKQQSKPVNVPHAHTQTCIFVLLFFLFFTLQIMYDVNIFSVKTYVSFHMTKHTYIYSYLQFTIISGRQVNCFSFQSKQVQLWRLRSLTAMLMTLHPHLNPFPPSSSCMSGTENTSEEKHV